MDICWRTAEQLQIEFQDREKSQAVHMKGTIEYDFATKVKILESNAEERSVLLQYYFLPYMKNAWGQGHGGAQAMMLDHAMAAVIRNQLNHDVTPTVNLQLNFLKAASMEMPYHIYVKLEHIGKKLVMARAEAWSADRNCLCTTAMGTYILK